MNLIEQIKVNDVSIDGYQGTYYSENQEFIKVVTDSEGKLLETTRPDGSKIIYLDAKVNGDFNVLGQIDLNGSICRVVENPEWVKCVLDSEDRILYGIKTDGSFIANIKIDDFDELKDLRERLEKFEEFFSIEDNPDFMSVETDSEGRVLGGRRTDGVKFENVEFETEKLNISGNQLSSIDDIEERSEMIIDSENRIISYRKSDGTKVENVGILTPYLNIDYIKNQTESESIYLEKPKFAEFWFYGNLPTDTSNKRTPTVLDFLYKVNNQVLLSAKCTLAIQGHGSIEYPKKGYTFEPLNRYDEAIDIKWGDMIAVDSYHLKAYYSDRTHSRGVGGAKVWRNMISCLPSPYNKINNKPYNIDDNQKTDAFCIADAKYSEDGFPCAFYLNDKFYGLYTLKLKKNRQNYAMEKGNKSEIFLDCLGWEESGGHSAQLEYPFDAAAWELKNPKLKNYEEGGQIPDADVLNSIERLFYFTNNIATEYVNHEDYIVLPHWICWYIFCEVIGHSDVVGNNLELFTWDNVHWSILPYDFDLTVGIRLGEIKKEQSGYILSGFYETFRECFEDEIKLQYTMLRKRHCIDIDNMYKMYVEQVNNIPRSIYEKDIKLWPDTFWENGFPVIEQIYYYLNSRIEYLDSVWLINE